MNKIQAFDRSYFGIVQLGIGLWNSVISLIPKLANRIFTSMESLNEKSNKCILVREKTCQQRIMLA